jgi:DNA-binding NtrC family response regulator
VLCDDEILNPEHFPQIISSDSFRKAKKTQGKVYKKRMEMIDVFFPDGKCKDLEEIEQEIVAKLLEFFDNNLTEVSKQLKVGRSTIYRKLKPEIQNN